MIVTIKHNEVKEGARGPYLYIQYVTDKGKESGKAIFGDLSEKWGMCENDATVELKLDSKYNVIDILPIKDQLPPPTKPPVPKSGNPPKPHAINYIDSETAKVRSICVSYAKDAWIAGKIEYKQIYACADMFLKYVRNEEIKQEGGENGKES